MDSLLKMRFIALVLAVLLASLAGVLALIRVDEEVACQGVTEPVDYDEVRARESHVIEEILVDEGDEVTRGRLIARFDARDLREALAQQEEAIGVLESQRDVAVASLDKVAAIPFEKQLELARLNVERAKERHKTAVDQTEKTAELVEKNFASKRELDLARSAEKLAALELEAAQRQLEITEHDPDRKDLERAKSQVAQVDAQLASAREEKERLLKRLKERDALAPRDGRIISIPFEEGEKPAVGDVLFGIDGGGGWIAKIRIPEDSVGKVEVGQRVRISSPAYPYRLYGYADGKLVFLGESVIREPASAYSLGIVQVEESPFPLKNGATVRAEIITDRLSPFQLMFGKKTGRR